MNKILSSLEALKKFSDHVLTLNEPLRDASILEKFESDYKIKLPEDYKFFLAQHNGLDFVGTSVCGTSYENQIESLEMLYKREHFEVQYPQYPHLVPFSSDGGGNFYCFDTSVVTENGNSNQIVFWLSNYPYTEDDRPDVVNDSFSDWMEIEILGWANEHYNYDGSSKD